MLPALQILLVEDNPINQKVASRLLEKAGHAVTIAGNGKEAVDQVAARTFDLVLMDVQMPEMDGLEATQVIRQQEQDRAAPADRGADRARDGRRPREVPGSRHGRLRHQAGADQVLFAGDGRRAGHPAQAT